MKQIVQNSDNYLNPDARYASVHYIVPSIFFPVGLKFFVVKRLKINCKLLKAVKAWVLSHGVQIPGERPGMDVFRLPEILRTMADPSPGLRFTGEPRRAHRKGAPKTLPLPRVTCS